MNENLFSTDYKQVLVCSCDLQEAHYYTKSRKPVTKGNTIAHDLHKFTWLQLAFHGHTMQVTVTDLKVAMTAIQIAHLTKLQVSAVVLKQQQQQ